MERYRLMLRRFTQALLPIYLDTSEGPIISTSKIRIVRIILVGGGVVPGKVVLY
jgi:hypothetical protein